MFRRVCFPPGVPSNCAPNTFDRETQWGRSASTGTRCDGQTAQPDQSVSARADRSGQMNLSIPSLTPDRLAGVSCSSQPMPSGAVFDKPDRVVRSLLNLANAPGHVEPLGFARAGAVELDAHQRSLRFHGRYFGPALAACADRRFCLVPCSRQRDGARAGLVRPHAERFMTSAGQREIKNGGSKRIASHVLAKSPPMLFTSFSHHPASVV